MNTQLQQPYPESEHIHRKTFIPSYLNLKSVSRFLLLALFLVLFTGLESYASHFKGGQITYQYLNNGRYKITVKGYWRANSGFNGFGALEYTGSPTINTPLTVTSSVILPDGITEELIEEQEVTWSSPGLYEVSTAASCCRIAGGNNFSQSSYQLSTAINYDPTNPSSSPQFFDIPVFNYRPGTPLSFSFNSVDVEGHVQEWSLSTPYDVSPNLYDDMNGFSVSSTGDVTWTNPVSGLWLINVKVEERINGQLTGAYVFRDFMLNITSSAVVNNPPVMPSIPTQSATAGESMSFNVSASDPDGNNVTLLANGLPMTLGATFAQNNTGSSVTGTFSWTPPAGQTGNYTMQFVATDNSTTPLSTQTNVVIEVRLDQTISFAAIPDMSLGDPPFELSATASSGLPVSFSIVSGPATISGNTVTLTGAGPVTIRATQAGDGTYSAADPVERTFNVTSTTKQNQTITFAPISDRTLGDPPFMLNATASSGLPVTFMVVSGPATVSGNMLTMTGAGTVVVRAMQGGDADYNAATPVDRSFEVMSAPVATGGIYWEYLWRPPSWADVPSNGGVVPAYIPSGTQILPSFATPRNHGQRYFSRARGYVVAPISGNYVFMVAGDDHAELWLSTDEDPANKTMIAHVYSHTAQFQYDKYASQTSAQVYLQAGQRYYIEALHREYRGIDHLSVGWVMPGGTVEQVISGQYLRPYEPDGIVWEYLMNPPAWGDVPTGGAVIPEFEPTRSLLLPSFATPRNVGQQYFSRARGYVVAPMSGNYVFMLAGDDHAELWLSTDEDPANKTMIAHVYSHTGQFQYDKFASQTSVSVYLEAGQRYYIEALHREYRGVDHLSVGWIMPDGTMEQAISGQYLRMYKPGIDPLGGLVSESGVIIKSPKAESRAEEADPLLAYPNPFHRDLTVEFSLEQDEEQVVVEVFSLHGKRLETLHNGRAEAGVKYSYTFNGDRHSTGVYLCRMMYQGKSVVKRIVLAK